MSPEWLVTAPRTGEFYTDERCFITELLNTPLSPETSLALARVAVGVTTQLHALSGITERYVLRKGSGIVEIDGVAAPLAVGDQAIIGPGQAQRITNNGATDLEFYCVCTPRFSPAAYVNLES